MIPGFDFAQFAQNAGPTAAVLILMAIIFAESGLLIGFFLPGDSILFTAGFLVFAGILKFDIHLLALLVFAAAVAGDSVGYTFGRKVGRRLFRRPNSLLFRRENIMHAENFYEKHGSITIIIARFIPVVRTFAPIVAGVGKMDYRRFLAFNAVGAFLWAAGVTYLGYYAGAALDKVGIKIDTILLPIIFVIILLSILPPAIHILRSKERRQSIVSGIKHYLEHRKN